MFNKNIILVFTHSSKSDTVIPDYFIFPSFLTMDVPVDQGKYE